MIREEDTPNAQAGESSPEQLLEMLRLRHVAMNAQCSLECERYREAKRNLKLAMRLWAKARRRRKGAMQRVQKALQDRLDALHKRG